MFLPIHQPKHTIQHELDKARNELGNTQTKLDETKRDLEKAQYNVANTVREEGMRCPCIASISLVSILIIVAAIYMIVKNS